MSHPNDLDLDTRTIDLDTVDVLRLTVTDIHGQQRTCRHCVSGLQEAATNGCEVFAGTTLHGILSEDVDLPVLNDTLCGNVRVVPIAETLRPLPWTRPLRVAELLCETRLLHPESKRGEPQPQATRYIARRLLEQLDAEFGLLLYSAFEFEFIDLTDTLGRACATSMGGACKERALSDACKQLREAGVDLHAFSREYAVGQYEMNQTPAYGVEVADQAVRFKAGIKEIFPAGSVTFMPKPLYSECCNGLHFNFSLRHSSDRTDAFTSGRDPSRLSDLAYHWLAGLLEHSAALSTLCNPTVNCYRRLHNEWTAGLAYYDLDDRHAAFRVRNTTPEAFVESRIPSGAANPYLVVAAHVAAGLDGLSRRLRCPARRDLERCERLPKTLELGLRALEGDEVMVRVLGEEFVQAFCFIKRSVELKKLEGVNVLEKPTCQGDLKQECDLYLLHV